MLVLSHINNYGTARCSWSLEPMFRMPAASIASIDNNIYGKTSRPERRHYCPATA